ncbi:hypothetical protein BKA57DRAFT_477193 [Linnemannia elongata]|nr:hypothetical protein BKA57DRAFT_477193 [Linnemannia elongata]
MRRSEISFFTLIALSLLVLVSTCLSVKMNSLTCLINDLTGKGVRRRGRYMQRLLLRKRFSRWLAPARKPFR